VLVATAKMSLTKLGSRWL